MPHNKSKVCMELGVPFVIAVDQIIHNPMASTEYGGFYKKCLVDRVVGAITGFVFENEMLCALMCCCDMFPASGAPKKLYQGCVKDILDEANELTKGKRKIPSTRFLAEPDINTTHTEFGRGRMNPGGPTRSRGDIVKRPDVGILKTPPSSHQSRIALDDVDRFVEMKFPTESFKRGGHYEQLKEYALWGKPVTLMSLGEGARSAGVPGVTTWTCRCAKDRKKILEKGVVYEPQVEFEKNRTLAMLGLVAIGGGVGAGTAGATIGIPTTSLPAWGHLGRYILAFPGL